MEPWYVVEPGPPCLIRLTYCYCTLSRLRETLPSFPLVARTGTYVDYKTKQPTIRRSNPPPGARRRAPTSCSFVFVVRPIILLPPTVVLEVFRVFFKRVLLALKGMVAGGDAAEVCERNGMQSFVDELRPAGVRLHRLFAHNVKASLVRKQKHRIRRPRVSLPQKRRDCCL